MAQITKCDICGAECEESKAYWLVVACMPVGRPEERDELAISFDCDLCPECAAKVHEIITRGKEAK